MRFVLRLWLVLVGCTATDDADMPAPDDWMLERTCVAPAGLGRPERIDDVVALVDAMGKGGSVSLACVLESLDRPLTVAAATSPFSAQPTEDPTSPRLFVFSGEVVMSIVTDGEASHTLELGEYVAPGRTLKGELAFPTEVPLDPEAVFAETLVGDSSRCSTCHDSTQFAGMVGDVATYTSESLAPEPARVVPIGFVAQHARDCDGATDTERCVLLGAVFGHGEVRAGEFRPEDRICITP
jgi:hypothetical protein